MMAEIFTLSDKVVLFSKRLYQSVNFFQDKIDDNASIKF